MLHLVDDKNIRRSVTPLINSEAGGHHASLLESYIHSHRARGHAPSTIALYEGFLKGWFRQFGAEERPLYTWHAMEPIVGRDRIREYTQMLVEAGLTSKTIRSYLMMLMQYFSFFLDHPYVKSEGKSRRIDELYGEIRQPSWPRLRQDVDRQPGRERKRGSDRKQYPLPHSSPNSCSHPFARGRYLASHSARMGGE